MVGRTRPTRCSGVNDRRDATTDERCWEGKRPTRSSGVNNRRDAGAQPSVDEVEVFLWDSFDLFKRSFESFKRSRIVQTFWSFDGVIRSMIEVIHLSAFDCLRLIFWFRLVHLPDPGVGVWWVQLVWPMLFVWFVWLIFWFAPFVWFVWWGNSFVRWENSFVSFNELLFSNDLLIF